MSHRDDPKPPPRIRKKGAHHGGRYHRNRDLKKFDKGLAGFGVLVLIAAAIVALLIIYGGH